MADCLKGLTGAPLNKPTRMCRMEKQLRYFQVIASIAFIALSHVHARESLKFDYSQTDHETRLKFSVASLEAVKVLDSPSPTRKIILKLSGVTVPVDELLSREIPAPAFSAVQGFRLIPYSGNLLVIVDLLAPVEYQFRPDSSGFQVSLQDGSFRDPVENQYLQALVLHRRGELRQALMLYRKIVHQRRDHRYAFFKAGQIRLQWKEYRTAETNFKIALRNDCDSTGLYLALGRLYRATGKKELAENYEQQYEKLTSRPVPVRNTVETPDMDSLSPREFAANGFPESLKSLQPLAAHVANAEITGSGKSAVDVRFWLYAIGSAILLLFLMAWLARSLRRKGILRKNPDLLNQSGQESLFPEVADGSETVPEKFTAAQADPVAQTGMSNKASGSGASRRISRLQEMVAQFRASTSRMPGHPDESEKQDNPVDQTAGDWPERSEPEHDSGNSLPYDLKSIARRLGLGLGEVELAMKLSERTGQIAGQEELRGRVLQLHRENYSIAEIARRTGMGRGEIELILRLSEQTASVPVD